ncbi:uncharacterized protein LOC114274003 isoform X3 [Camellia sinensis]|uniref:uncharacterized protein LOC114274003 isoform X3 n=2 Tax=Camellia sinensis TaxID=4442 RepID=UPI001036D208|nr:uncharacterized protein LOC114274003 isoform X3 [Camellia sinensis]
MLMIEHLDTITPFSGFGIKKMGESKVQRVNTYGMQRAHLQMDDRQSKTALEEEKLEDAVSCRAKFCNTQETLIRYYSQVWSKPRDEPLHLRCLPECCRRSCLCSFCSPL